ncbi:carbon-nitrogen hydrolase family protein [Actinophytocola oryzae]|uniref:Nitrilase n=1 Tax=Actinophytocola oryzae TaxID=502181 RepID=A0A4V3FV15_9PSEU|nr:carbon-nitrogen hydrolase family protein [Actinophytocola oryzae]TDV57351.1 nitrilase [Actinophytocola oryzae]
MRSRRVGVVQGAPRLFEPAETHRRFESLLGRAVEAGAELVAFPEAFVGGYPKGATFGATVGARTTEGRALFARYRRAAVDDFAPLQAIVARHRVHVVVGVVERAGHTLYCASLLIAPDGTLLGHHRKLLPTGTERLIWGQGDASDVTVVATDLGRIGMAICWENYMPLYRAELYRQGVEIYCAPTVDTRDTWAATMRHVGVEGRCFVLSATQFAVRDDYPADFPLGDEPVVIRGGSCVVDPFGTLLAGPVFDREDVLVTDLDLDLLDGAYLDLDVSGHYARPDLFQLTTTEGTPRV